MKLLPAIPIVLALAGCSGSGNECADWRVTGTMLTPELGDCHPGYKHQNCGTCHDIPAPDHFITNTAECSGCHGGNGACTPPEGHGRSDDCFSCHGQMHTYTVSDECSMCHFAHVGVVPCP